jgi:hypothetical protein
MNTKKD